MPIKKNCKICNKEFSVIASRALTAKCCSKECYYKSRLVNNIIQKICPTCQKEFSHRPKKRDRKFCSIKCAGFRPKPRRNKPTLVEKTCPICNKSFSYKQTEQSKKTCSKKCGDILGGLKKIKHPLKKCVVCNKNLKRQRESFCSKECRLSVLWENGKKRCGRCLVFKDVGEFFKCKSAKTGLKSTCKTCVGHLQRARDVKVKYNLDVEDVERLKEAQNNTCLICKTQTDKLKIDHCHSTGKFRGLICNGCNSGLGMFRENIEAMKEAIKYLRTHKSSQTEI